MNGRRLFLGLPFAAAAALPAADAPPAPALALGFPTQDPDLVRELVGASHAKFDRVRELVDARPALAKVSWDWGFNDWETALGAASHVGRREIALYLIDKGAQPTIFSAAMLGQLDVVKAFVAASPGIQKLKGPHTITLLSHARAGAKQAEEVVAWLESIGGADERPALAPLTAEEKDRLTGIYWFGSGPTDKFEVKVSNRGQLIVERAPRTSISIHHLGSYAFYPAGADSVRIRFTMSEGKPKSLTVHDPGLIVTADLR
jgi:hypothetical protein